MKPILTVKKTREVDQRTTKEYGIPSLILMENAGRALAQSIQEFITQNNYSAPVFFVCGGGNNGGDGFVAARHLDQEEIETCLYLLTDPNTLKGDASLNYSIANKIGLPIKSFSDLEEDISNLRQDQTCVLVDALLGTGFKGSVRPEIAQAILAINQIKKSAPTKIGVVAVDIPSGLDGDKGPIGEPTVNADLTVTFGAAKPGLVKSPGPPQVGRLKVVDIGIPKKLLASYNE